MHILNENFRFAPPNRFGGDPLSDAQRTTHVRFRFGAQFSSKLHYCMWVSSLPKVLTR